MLTNCFPILDNSTNQTLLVEIGLEVSDLEIKQHEHRSLRDLAQTRIKEHITVLETTRRNLLVTIGNLFAARQFSLTSEKIAVDAYKRELTATECLDEPDVTNLVHNRQSKVELDIVLLNGWYSGWIEKASNASTLQELSELRKQLENSQGE